MGWLAKWAHVAPGGCLFGGDVALRGGSRSARGERAAALAGDMPNQPDPFGGGTGEWSAKKVVEG